VDVRVTYDGAANSVHIDLVPIGPGEVDISVPGEDEASNVILNFNKEGRLIGINVQSARKSLPPEVIAQAERVG
jgi:uncharacterized protein YuzE